MASKRRPQMGPRTPAELLAATHTWRPASPGRDFYHLEIDSARDYEEAERSAEEQILDMLACEGTPHWEEPPPKADLVDMFLEDTQMFIREEFDTVVVPRLSVSSCWHLTFRGHRWTRQCGSVVLELSGRALWNRLAEGSDYSAVITMWNSRWPIGVTNAPTRKPPTIHIRYWDHDAPVGGTVFILTPARSPHSTQGPARMRAHHDAQVAVADAWMPTWTQFRSGERALCTRVLQDEMRDHPGAQKLRAREAA